MKNKFFIALLLLFPSMISASCLIQGNAQADQNITLTFGAGAYYYNPETDALILGADQNIPDNNYALAGSIGGAPFMALAPKTVQLNGEPDQPNPMNGKKIKMLKFGSLFSVVTADEPQTLYVRTDMAGDPAASCYSSLIFADPIQIIETGMANGKSSVYVATEKEFAIVSLDTTPITNTQILHEQEKKFVETFVKEQSQKAFEPDELEKRKKELEEHYYNRPTLKIVKSESLYQVIRCPFDTEQVKSITIQDMYWDKQMQHLYMTYAVETEDMRRTGILERSWYQSEEAAEIEHEQQSTDHKSLTIIDVSDEIFTHVRTMQTTSRLPYLIIGQGAELYALPLLTEDEQPVTIPALQASQEAAKQEAQKKDETSEQQPIVRKKHRTFFLADDAPAPTTTFFPNYPFPLKSRRFSEPLQRNLTRSNSRHLRVGGQALPIDDVQEITGIQTCNDAVIVSVKGRYSYGGLYITQALLDTYGRIKGWTPWRHIGGSDQALAGFGFCPRTARYWLLQQEQEAYSVRMTQWTDVEKESDHFVYLLNQAFPRSAGGIEQIISISDHRMVVQGAGKVALLNTALDLRKNCRAALFEHGSYSHQRLQEPLIFISGGEVSNIGTISAAIQLSDGCLALGGTHGLVLEEREMNQEGTFKKFGSYRHVKKLYQEDNYLFVLTLKTFDRINLNTHEVVTLATPSSMQMPKYSFFTDGSVSGKQMVIASSYGLYVSDREYDIRSQTASEIRWHELTLPEGSRMVRSLKFFSSTDNEHDFIQHGMMYVLSGGEDEMTSIHRFTCEDGIIEPIQDKYIEHQLSAFVQYAAPCMNFDTDGALLYILRYKNDSDGPSIAGLNIKSGERFLSNFGSIDLLKIDAQKGYGIKLARHAANGSWLAYGDFGVLVHE